jgi:hypothetical protein
LSKLDHGKQRQAECSDEREDVSEPLRHVGGVASRPPSAGWPIPPSVSEAHTGAHLASRVREGGRGGPGAGACPFHFWTPRPGGQLVRAWLGWQHPLTERRQGVALATAVRLLPRDLPTSAPRNTPRRWSRRVRRTPRVLLDVPANQAPLATTAASYGVWPADHCDTVSGARLRWHAVCGPSRRPGGVSFWSCRMVTTVEAAIPPALPGVVFDDPSPGDRRTVPLECPHALSAA